jgi:surfactin synthase thioesterase subunit
MSRLVKPKLHFSHGNGFPSPCYRQMLTALEPDFECCYIDKVGHTPEFPVLDNWEALTDEVIASVRRQSDEPVVAVGHSLGGGYSICSQHSKRLSYFKRLFYSTHRCLAECGSEGFNCLKNWVS